MPLVALESVQKKTAFHESCSLNRRYLSKVLWSEYHIHDMDSSTKAKSFDRGKCVAIPQNQLIEAILLPFHRGHFNQSFISAWKSFRQKLVSFWIALQGYIYPECNAINVSVVCLLIFPGFCLAAIKKDRMVLCDFVALRLRFRCLDKNVFKSVAQNQ